MDSLCEVAKRGILPFRGAVHTGIRVVELVYERKARNFLAAQESPNKPPLGLRRQEKEAILLRLPLKYRTEAVY